MISLSWPSPPEGSRHPRADLFLALVAKHTGFWGADFALKYLGVHIDTREGCWFRLTDRDGNTIHPDRVLAAIAVWRSWHPHVAIKDPSHD